MANVSSSNGLEKRPKLRFPGFEGTWKKTSLASFLSENNDRNRTLLFSKEDVLSVSGEYGIVNQIAFQGRSFAGESVAEYHVVETGDIVYTKSPLKANPFGIVKVNNGCPGIVSTLYAVYHPKDTVCPQFVDYYFANDLRLNKFLKPLVNIGAKHDMKVNNEFVLTGEVIYPSRAEQEQIVSFLSVLDEKILMHRQLIESLKKYKRGLSNELLGENETTEGWTTVPFGEVFELLQNNTFSRDEMSTESGIAYNIHYGDVLIKYGAVVNLSKSKVPYIRSDMSLSKYAPSSYLRDGDIVIADTAEDYTVGKAVEMVGITDTKVLSGLHTIPCRPKISFAPMYLSYFINSKRFRTQILPLVQGTKVSSISKSELIKTIIAFPSFGVQSRIASMLYALDYKIDICQACIQDIVRTKEALLQQLFI